MKKISRGVGFRYHIDSSGELKNTDDRRRTGMKKMKAKLMMIQHLVFLTHILSKPSRQVQQIFH